MRAKNFIGLGVCLAIVGSTLVLASCGGGAEAPGDRRHAGNSAPRKTVLAVPKPDAGALFDWAEAAYPQFFPSHRSNAVLAPYTYRYYPESGNYLGLDGDTVAVLGPVSGGSILVVGNVSDFACQVYPVECLSGYRFTALASTMNAPRAMHTATLLADGQVLITGGFGATGQPAPALDTAELYDPRTGAFTALAARMRSARTQHAAVRLPDGQVLITGGQADTNNGDGVDTAELYDPPTRSFLPLAAGLASPRGGHTATLLNDGKVVLIAGYYRGPGTLKSIAEIYDPITGSFTALQASMTVVRQAHESVLLPDGNVLVVGGSGGSRSPSAIVEVELFDPVTKTFSTAATMATSSRAGHEALSLPGGAVVLVGGTPNFSPAGGPVLSSAEVYDPRTKTFAPIPAAMVSPRVGAAGVLLQDGTALITGGLDSLSGGLVARNDAERFAPQ
jgi:hypothetical protein